MTDHSKQFLDLEAKDFTKFFLNEDSLRVLDYELTLTLGRRYKCAAGCDICYLKNKWMSDSEYEVIGKYSEENLTPYWEELFFDFAKNFSVISTMDDLRFLKRNYPVQYSFYKKYAEEFHLSSMTDQSLFYQLSIIMKEMRFKSIYEISFSDIFILANYKRLQKVLNEITKVYSIRQIKIVYVSEGLSSAEKQILGDFTKFLEDKGISTHGHHNFNKDWMKVEDSAHAIYSESNGPIALLNQSLYLGFDSLYTGLADFTSESDKYKIASLEDIKGDFNQLLPRILDTKLMVYRNNANTLKNKESKFVKYFDHCAKTFQVNHDYNFIPYPLIRYYAEWPKKLIASGEWEDIEVGYLKQGATAPKSIIKVIK